jgi:hypothetical protein
MTGQISQKLLVFTCQTTRRHIQKYHNLTIRDHEYLTNPPPCDKKIIIIRLGGRFQIVTPTKQTRDNYHITAPATVCPILNSMIKIVQIDVTQDSQRTCKHNT